MMSWGRALLKVMGDNAAKGLEERQQIENKQEEYREKLQAIAVEQYKTAMQNYNTKREMYEKISSSPNFITYARIMGVPAGKEHEYDLSELKAKWDKDVKPNITEWTNTYKAEAPSLDEYIQAAENGALASGYKFDDDFSSKVGRLFGVATKYREPEIRQGLQALSKFETESMSDEDKRIAERAKYSASPLVRGAKKPTDYFYLMNATQTKVISFDSNPDKLEEMSKKYPGSFVSKSPTTKDEKESNPSYVYVVAEDGTVSQVLNQPNVVQQYTANGATVHNNLKDANEYREKTQTFLLTATDNNGESVVSTVVGASNAHYRANVWQENGYSEVNVMDANAASTSFRKERTRVETKKQAFLANQSIMLFDPQTFETTPVIKGTSAYTEGLNKGLIPIEDGNDILSYMSSVNRLEQLESRFDFEKEYKNKVLGQSREALQARVDAAREALESRERIAQANIESREGINAANISSRESEGAANRESREGINAANISSRESEGAANREAQSNYRKLQYELAVANFLHAKDKWETQKDSVEAQTEYRETATILLNMELEDKKDKLNKYSDDVVGDVNGNIYSSRKDVPPGVRVFSFDDEMLYDEYERNRDQQVEQQASEDRAWEELKKDLIGDVGKYLGTTAISDQQAEQAKSRVKSLGQNLFGVNLNTSEQASLRDSLETLANTLIRNRRDIVSAPQAINLAARLLKDGIPERGIESSASFTKGNMGMSKYLNIDVDKYYKLLAFISKQNVNNFSTTPSAESPEDVRSQVRRDLLGEE